MKPPPFDALLVGHPYRSPLDAVIHGLKYASLDYLGRHLADSALRSWSTGRLTSMAPILDRGDIVTHVPLHWRRRAVRGYDQAEEIARPLALSLGLRLAHPLRRTKATRPQVQLDRAKRHENLRGSFAIRRRSEVAGRTVLLVDDVVTTGATMIAAATELRRAGAISVIALAIGRTPKGDDPDGSPANRTSGKEKEPEHSGRFTTV